MQGERLSRNKNSSWHQWELDVAEIFGGTVSPGSGNGMMRKADVKSEHYLIDCKYTEAKSYYLSANLWNRIAMWGRNESRIPLIAVRFSTIKDEKSESGMKEVLFYDPLDMGWEGPSTFHNFEHYSDLGVTIKFKKHETPFLVSIDGRQMAVMDMDQWLAHEKGYRIHEDR